MTYPFSDCCPNLPGAGRGYSPCDDGWCCTHEAWHEPAEEVPDHAQLSRMRAAYRARRR